MTSALEPDPEGTNATAALRMRQAVIFDVEGTLIDCAPAILQSWQDVLEGFGIEVSRSRLQELSGRDTDEMLADLLPNVSDETRKRIAEEQGHHYRARYLDGVTPVPGAAGALVDLRRAGKRIGLATSCKRDELDRYLEISGCRDLVDCAACGDDAKRGKPHADLFAVALSGLQLSASAAMAVGDSPYDARAAGALGMASIGVLTGGFSAAALLAAGCVQVVRAVSDIRPFAG
jgi:phosphoglycolate phosphatase-like HAD superfamily hydrolase